MQIINQTKAWLRTFIIAKNICPFAQRVFDQNSIHYAIVETKLTEQCLHAVHTECLRLDEQTEIETTLIIYPNQFTEFDDYLDFLALAESLLIAQGYEGLYQLASFHPHYCFEGADSNDPANYTNRSPYPMLHLIREASIEQALQSFPHPELIPERNIELTRTMGVSKIQTILNKAMTVSKN